MSRVATILLIGFAAASLAAPVPAHLMPRMQVELRHDDKDHALGNNYEIVLRNVGAAELTIWTDRPYGLAAFLDFEIVNDKGARVSRFDPWGTPGSVGDPVRLRATIPAKTSHTIKLPIFESVPENKLIPGRYKVRARFRYRDQDAVSEWLAVSVSEHEIRTKSAVLGP